MRKRLRVFFAKFTRGPRNLLATRANYPHPATRRLDTPGIGVVLAGYQGKARRWLRLLKRESITSRV